MSKKVNSKKTTTREKKLYPKEKDMMNDYYNKIFCKNLKAVITDLNLHGYSKINK